jgi:hypothetical protein
LASEIGSFVLDLNQKIKQLRWSPRRDGRPESRCL